MKQKKFLILCIALASGCHSLQRETVDVSNAEEALVHAARSIEQSLRLLSEAESQESKPLIDVSELVTEEGGLGGKVTLDWSGPIEPLLEKLADMSDYQVRVIGQAPPIPVMVSITQERQVVAEVLKDAGLQTGSKAAIVVYPSTRIIELRYTPVT